MRLQEFNGNIHGEIVDYLESKSPEDVQDIVRYIGGWISSKGMKPLSWKKGLTGTGSTMYTFKFVDQNGSTKWLAFDDQMGVGDIMDNEPNPASYS